MTLKKRGCIEKDHKDIYCIEGDVNMLREKIKRKFIDSEKSETLHFGDVNREEILLRKLLNHNQSKKAFIEDHLVKMKVLLQRIITLEKENEKCTSVAQENKHLRQEVKYWKNHAQEAERISSYSMKMDSYIQELEKRVYMLKEELLEAFKREYKLKKDINSQKMKELKYETTNFDDTFLRDLLEARKSCLRGKAMEMEKERIKRFIYSDEMSNVEKSDEQVSTSYKREYKTRKKFPASRSKEVSESNISLMKRLDNRDMISKECRHGEQEEEEQMKMGNKMQRLINENQEIKFTMSNLQKKSPIGPKKSTEYTDEEETDEGKSDEEDSDEACEQELEGKINSQGGKRFELSKVWENLSVLEKSLPRKYLPLEEQEKIPSKNEVASRDKGVLEENYMSSKTVMGGKVGIGITAMQESNRQLLGRTRISRESSDALKEEMLLQRRSTSDERTFNERTAETKDNKFYSERNEAEELYLPSDSTESLPIKVNYEMRKRVDGKDRHQSSHERFHASPERYKEFKSVEFKDGESSMTERGAECQDEDANIKPTTDKSSSPLKEIGSFSNYKKSEKEKYVPQKAQKVKHISSKIEAPLEENQSRAKEKQYEVKEKQLFPDDITSKSKERDVVSKEKLILPDNTAAPSKGRENVLVEDKERAVSQAKEIDIIVKEKKIIPEDAAAQSKDRGSTIGFPGSTNTQTKGRENLTKDIQAVQEGIALQSNKRDTIDKKMEVLQDTQAKEMISEEIQAIPEDITPQSIKTDTNGKEIKVPQPTQAKEMLSEEIQAVPEETTTLSKERKTMFKQMQAHSDDIATQCTERETMLEEMKVLPTKSITQSKERAKIQAASEEKTTQSTEKKTMFEQLRHIPEDTETQSNASEILINSKQTPHGDRTQFKGRNFLTDVMQAQPKETIVASKWSEFNQKSVPQEKEFNFQGNAGTPIESTFINEKPVEEKFEMMKKERELMLKDAIAEGKFVLSGLGTAQGKPGKEKWSQLMNRNEKENLLTKEVFDKPAKYKPEMLREVKEHKTNHFPYREKMTIPSRRETVRKPTKETQPLGMDRNCRCKKENYFLEQVLNFQETTQKTNIKEDVIRTEVSKIISLKYKREDIALNCQPPQETIHNRIHDLIHTSGRKECGQTFSFTNKIYQGKHEAGLRENTVDDNYLHASILQYQNELQEVEQETDQLINVVQDLLGALGTSFKLLKEDKMKEELKLKESKR